MTGGGGGMLGGLGSLRLWRDAAEEELPEVRMERVAQEVAGPVGGDVGEGVDLFVRELRRSEASRSAVIQQFLRARQGDPVRAGVMLRGAVAWREQVGIRTYLDGAAGYLGAERACFPMRVLTDPRKGHRRPVCYGLLRLLDAKMMDRDAFLDATKSWLEMVYGMDYEVESITVILDLSGWSIRKHTPYRSVKDGIMLLQDYYPDRLDRVFVVNYPSSMRAAFTVINPILDAGAREKIHFLRDSPGEVIAEYLPRESLPVFLGGALSVDFGPDVDLAKEWAEAEKASSTTFSFF